MVPVGCKATDAVGWEEYEEYILFSLRDVIEFAIYRPLSQFQKKYQNIKHNLSNFLNFLKINRLAQLRENLQMCLPPTLRPAVLNLVTICPHIAYHIDCHIALFGTEQFTYFRLLSHIVKNQKKERNLYELSRFFREFIMGPSFEKIEQKCFPPAHI